jgi:Cytosol aminopeptidase family, N-terminal domain
MDLRFCPTDMGSLSELKTEALCLPFYRDERPLRGPAGLVDFRLCGKVSKLIAGGRMAGDLGEAVLMPARPRLSAERLVWIGAGLASELGEPRFRELVKDVLVRLSNLRVRAAALSLPGRVRGQIEAVAAIDWFLEEARGFSERLDELTLLEPADAARLMQPRVDRARRRPLSEP